MRSEDWFEGTVVQILDGDSFQIEIDYEGKNNDFPYSALEVIRLGKGGPSVETEEGALAMRQLEQQLINKKVKCYVLARQQDGSLRCDVHLVSKI